MADDMMLGVAHPRRFEALRKGLRMAGEGWALEFGVHKGTTLRMIVAARGGLVAGFDSFEGLPEDWLGGWKKGTFAMDAPPEVVGAQIVKGWFHETLPRWLAAHREPIAFVHLDADLYSSTATVLSALSGRLRPGCILVFDEFHNFPGWHRHEAKAWYEFVERERPVYRMHTGRGTHQVIVEFL